MKKFFTFCAAMLVAFAVNATKTQITPTSPYPSDAVRLALYYSAEGDTIVLAAGTYEESNSDYIAFKRSNVVMAANDAEVIIKPHVSFRVRGGARAELVGVKIDASELNSLSSSYENIFEVHDATAGNCWVLRNCEVYGNSGKTMVRHASGKTLDSLIIDGCYIHNNPQAILRLQSPTLKGVIIKNSTFANVANGGSFWCAPIDISTTASDAKVVVDHCTFYHNTTISTSYADVTTGVDGSATSDVTVSNCIFAQPASYSAGRAINFTNGGTVTNCLTYNYTKSTDGIQGETTRTSCITGDPLFVDAANGDYHLSLGENSNVSPALRAGTDGTNLGDPRWWPTFNVRGTMNENPWSATEDEMEYDAENNVYYKEFEGLAATTYQFKINHGEWYADWGSANIDNTLGVNPLNLSDASGNISITPEARPFIIYFSLTNNKVWASYLYPKVEFKASFYGEPAWTPVDMDLAANKEYLSFTCPVTVGNHNGSDGFMIRVNGGSWVGFMNTVTRDNCMNWLLNSSSNTCGLQADLAGNYEFRYDIEDGKVDIVYPILSRAAAGNTNYQTLCTPYDATIEGATAYTITSANASAVNITSVAGGSLEAGRAYIIKPDAADAAITLTYDNTRGAASTTIVAEDHGGDTGLYGQLQGDYELSFSDSWKNNYVLLASDNLFHEIITGGSATIGATKAYLHIAGVGIGAPALRIIEGPAEATNINNIEAVDEAVKFIQNGQLFIKKNGIVYDVTGAIVK